MLSARALAETIDKKSKGFSRIVLVGHSHGGNICLAASGLCKRKIEAVFCLATPHVHLETKLADGRILNLPIYCKPRTWTNTGKIFTLAPDTDLVASIWAGVFPGVKDSQGLQNAEDWIEVYRDEPRLVLDHPISRLLKLDNIITGNRLNLRGATI